MRSFAGGECSTEGYDKIAQDYERGRMDYPQEIVPALNTALNLAPGKRVLDLAAGTGKLTKTLKPFRVSLCAVEPVAEMRSIFAQQFPEIPIFEGTAESIPLPSSSIDAVVVGTAFHWFDAERALKEISRVLAPKGSLGLVWNVFDTEVDWVKEIALLFKKYENHRALDTGAWKKAFRSNTQFTTLRHKAYRYTFQGTVHDVLARLFSAKVMGTLPVAERDKMINEVLAILDAHPDTRGKTLFEIPYRIEIYCCSKL